MPLIELQNIDKSFGPVTVLKQVSLKVEKGEILGFLGPNGAGKTTTMRIITGYMPASEGTVQVDGFDVFEKPLDVRRRIGYLPENPPLYPEMPVNGYLRFVAKIIFSTRLSSLATRIQPATVDRTALKSTCGRSPLNWPSGEYTDR